MDESTGLERRPGGTVEPENRAAIAKEHLRAPQQPAGERYELRDPFAEVTYRTAALEEMIGKANRLGATRFTAIAADGKRTPIFKAEGRWLRPDAPPPEPQTSKDVPTRAAGLLPVVAPAAPIARTTGALDAEAER